jgi:protein-disulfide isomerase
MSADRARHALAAALLCGTALCVCVADVPSFAQSAPPPDTVRAGAVEAPAQFVLFCDLEVESCGALVRVLGRLIDEQPQRVAVTFRLLASADYLESPVAYRVALAAARQGKGWQVLDALFSNRERLSQDTYRAIAQAMRLDPRALLDDSLDPELTLALDADASDAVRLDVKTVPALFLNGTRLADVVTYDTLRAAVWR